MTNPTLKPWKAALEARWREASDELKDEIRQAALKEARQIATYMGAGTGKGRMILKSLKYILLSKIFDTPLPPPPTPPPDCPYCGKLLRPDHGWICDTEGCRWNQ
jgi:hypothetical protein